MKEKDMLKNMFEQEHSSKALDMSADEILTANLGHGARVRSRGFAGAAIAAAAMLAVGVGAFALHTGVETADSGEKTPVAASSISSLPQEKPDDGQTETPAQPLKEVTHEQYYENIYKNNTYYVFCDDEFAQSPDYYIADEAYVSEIKGFISKYLNGEADCYYSRDCDGTQNESAAQFFDARDHHVYDGHVFHVLSYKDESGKYICIETSGRKYDRVYVKVYDELPDKFPEYLNKGKLVEFDEQSDLSKIMTALWDKTIDYRAKLGKNSTDEKTTTTITEKTPDAKSTEVEAKKPDNESDEPATTTVTYDPKDSYTPDEIQPLPRGEIDFADNPTIVHFTRSVDSSLPQADMSFRLIDWYEDFAKDMYDEYKSGNIKPAETLTMDDQPEQITGGTMMSVYWKNDNGGTVEFMGIDINEKKAYIRLTDLDENDTCATGKVFYFGEGNAVYQTLLGIWELYYPVYESIDEIP